MKGLCVRKCLTKTDFWQTFFSGEVETALNYLESLGLNTRSVNSSAGLQTTLAW